MYDLDLTLLVIGLVSSVLLCLCAIGICNYHDRKLREELRNSPVVNLADER